jgi:ureidoglycolate lyase
MRTLTIEPLTKEAFAPFGDVIETDGSDHFMINNGSTMRFHKLATVETATPEDKAIISIFRADAQDMPLTVSMLERHPLGSQAFIPLLGNPFLIVVAPLGDVPVSGLVRAFVTNGRQGINYHRGVWHHPVLTIEKRDDFLVVDRSGSGNNCDEHFFTEDEFDPRPPPIREGLIIDNGDRREVKTVEAHCSRMAEPERSLGSHDHWRRLDRRIVLLRLAGEQPEPRQPARPVCRRSVGDPRWRYLSPGKIQAGPTENAGEPALVQMGSLLHLDVGDRLLCVVFYSTRPSTCGTRQHPERAEGVAIGIGSLIAGWFIYDFLCDSPWARNRPCSASSCSC